MKKRVRITEGQLYRLVEKTIREEIDAYADEDANRYEDWEYVLDYIECDNKLGQKINSIVDALIKKAKKGVVLDRDYLANSSVIRRLCQIGVKLAPAYFEQRLYLSNDDKRLVREELADYILSFVNDEVTQNESIVRRIAEGVKHRIGKLKVNEWISRGDGFEIGNALVKGDDLLCGIVQMNCNLADTATAVNTIQQILGEATEEMIESWNGNEWENSNSFDYTLKFNDCPWLVIFKGNFHWSGTREATEDGEVYLNITYANFSSIQVDLDLQYSDEENEEEIAQWEQVLDVFYDTIDFDLIATNALKDE